MRRVEGANPELRKVPYTRDVRRTKFRIEFIYGIRLLLATACEGWVLVNTEESNNKSTESSKTKTEFKAMRKRSKNSKARMNVT